MEENAAAMEKKVVKTYRSDYRKYCKFMEKDGMATKAPCITANGASGDEEAKKPASPVPESEAAATNKPLSLGYMLRPTAKEPIIPAAFPTSVEQLLNQHNQGGWNKLRNAKKDLWEEKVRTRYSKRQNVYEAIERKARLLRSPSDVAARMMKAAQEMDKERGSRTVAAYAIDLRKKDPGFRQRLSKKQRVEEEEALDI